jgi:hypothetical protein
MTTSNKCGIAGFVLGFLAALAGKNGIWWAVIGGGLDAAIFVTVYNIYRWFKNKATN